MAISPSNYIRLFNEIFGTSDSLTDLLKPQEAEMNLMTPEDVRRRLDAGEEAIDLCIEHWLENAMWLKTQVSELPTGSYWSTTCALCFKHFFDCKACPLYKFQRDTCDSGAWKDFINNKTFDTAMDMVNTLRDCKAWMAEQKEVKKSLPQFYVWEEGKEPSGKVGLRLQELRSGVILRAVDSNGERVTNGNILIIRAGKSLYRCASINNSIGLVLDDNGRIRMTDE